MLENNNQIAYEKQNQESNEWIDVEDDIEELKENIINSQEATEEDEKENQENERYGIKNIKEITCQTIPNNEISQRENIQIKIGSFGKVQGKLFSKSYATYLITTMPFNWNVRRRFNDFEWLHQILSQEYKYCLIPSIPKKKNLNKLVDDKFDETFLRKHSRKFIFRRRKNICKNKSYRGNF